MGAPKRDNFFIKIILVNNFSRRNSYCHNTHAIPKCFAKNLNAISSICEESRLRIQPLGIKKTGNRKRQEFVAEGIMPYSLIFLNFACRLFAITLIY